MSNKVRTKGYSTLACLIMDGVSVKVKGYFSDGKINVGDAELASPAASTL
ncbi:MAG TPA: hypothetical protein VIX38_03940 [Nitrososphaeraceae archaeon]